LYVSTSISPRMSRMRPMLEEESVRITVFVGVYATRAASLETRGLSVFAMASASM
jgi:hypothetical protein